MTRKPMFLQSRRWNQVPWILILFRFLSGPVLLYDVLVWNNKGGNDDDHLGRVSRPFWPILFTMAVLSDVADGMVARRCLFSPSSICLLRQADSRADTTLYAFVALCMYYAFPDTLLRWRVPLLTMLVSHLLQWGVALLKYGQLASYHSWTAKVWGVSLGMATGFLFTFNYDGFLWPCVLCGIVNNGHEICMTSLLDDWTHDVWDIRAALRIQEEKMKRGRQSTRYP